MEAAERLPSGPSVSVRRVNKPIVSASALQVLEEQDEEYTVIPPIRCKCMNPRSQQVKPFFRRMREKKPTETVGDILDAMKVTQLCCRDYFINLPRLTMGVMRSGDATIIKKGDRPGERIDPHFPSKIITEPKKYVVYDKWYPLPPDAGEKKKKPEPRRYALTPQKDLAKKKVGDYVNLYELWKTEFYELFRVWRIITFPEYSPTPGGNLELLQGAFFMDLCGVIAAAALDPDILSHRDTKDNEIYQGQPVDLLAKLSRDLLFDETLESQALDTSLEDRQNVYLFFRRVEEDKTKTLRTSLMTPTKEGPLFFYLNDEALVVNLSPRQPGELVRDVILGNTETTGMVVGDMKSLESARIYARREKFHLPAEGDVKLLLAELRKRVQRKDKELKAKGKELKEERKGLEESEDDVTEQLKENRVSMDKNEQLLTELAENGLAVEEIEIAMFEKLSIWNRVKEKAKEEQEEEEF